MPSIRKKSKAFKFKKIYAPIAGIAVLILLAAIMLWSGNNNTYQAFSAHLGQVCFDGDYKIGDGDWHKIVEGEHIPATKGDVTLRGQFHLLDPEGGDEGIDDIELFYAPIAFYANHISLTFCNSGEEPITIETENPEFGDSSCGVIWTAYEFKFEYGDTDTVDIVVHNPHLYGNDTAIDEMLSNVALWMDMSFEKDTLAEGDAQRSAGLFLLIVSMLFIGTALFSTLIHVKNSKTIWLIAMLVLCAGLYFSFSADGVSFWNESVVSNTAMLGFSMMFYMLFLSMIISSIFKVTKRIGNIAVCILLVANAVFFILPMVSDLLFYDMWLYWMVAQVIVNTVLAACLVREIVTSSRAARRVYAGAFLPLVAFGVDVVGIGLGAWKGGIASKCVFLVLLVISVIMVLRLIPQNINAAAKAKELEMERVALNAELTESRMSTMMSQIRPHFIYNTLGTIEQLCDIDPPKAGELVHDFAKYLRGNFGELDNPKPILMSKEMEHVHHYISIENVRFPDMTFTFEMNSDDFKIPALTVQPIVENAIKHGLMKLQKGGTINVVSYETDTDYCISVVDDGVGFDMTIPPDTTRKHVGLHNIRERLRAIVGGTLEIESKVGEGTRVLIKIPKEGQK